MWVELRGVQNGIPRGGGKVGGMFKKTIKVTYPPKGKELGWAQKGDRREA